MLQFPGGRPRIPGLDPRAVGRGACNARQPFPAVCLPTHVRDPWPSVLGEVPRLRQTPDRTQGPPFEYPPEQLPLLRGLSASLSQGKGRMWVRGWGKVTEMALKLAATST